MWKYLCAIKIDASCSIQSRSSLRLFSQMKRLIPVKVVVLFGCSTTDSDNNLWFQTIPNGLFIQRLGNGLRTLNTSSRETGTQDYRVSMYLCRPPATFPLRSKTSINLIIKLTRYTMLFWYQNITLWLISVEKDDQPFFSQNRIKVTPCFPVS